ncbi:MAG: hypothetical protein GY913_19520 [Proteobacteria bacterium]|nr:hypothetical protein [Pseudomonadota bacterium]MCP4919100.1 hypothetical protein [Pseudomonadota bacterium]
MILALFLACAGGDAIDDADRDLYWYTAPEPPSCCSCTCSTCTLDVECTPDCGDCTQTCEEACPDEDCGSYEAEFEEC